MSHGELADSSETLEYRSIHQPDLLGVSRDKPVNWIADRLAYVLSSVGYHFAHILRSAARMSQRPTQISRTQADVIGSHCQCDNDWIHAGPL